MKVVKPSGVAGSSSRPGSHNTTNGNSSSHKRQAPWSANAADGPYAQYQQQQDMPPTPTDEPDHGTAILKTEVVHSGR